MRPETTIPPAHTGRHLKRQIRTACALSKAHSKLNTQRRLFKLDLSDQRGWEKAYKKQGREGFHASQPYLKVYLGAVDYGYFRTVLLILFVTIETKRTTTPSLIISGSRKGKRPIANVW